MTQVPAATRALEVLKLLAAQGPLPAMTIARELRLPRSSTYHLLTAMSESGFVVHLPEDERWGLGVAAFEVGAAFSRHDPLERLARPLLSQLVRGLAPLASVGHLAVLHGTETLYLLKVESARRLPLVTQVGVRLPAALTASGRAILSALPAAQVRADFGSSHAYVDRTGRGPQRWSDLQPLLASESAQGFSEEDGFIAERFASVAVPVRDHLHLPIAAIGLTFNSAELNASKRQRLAATARQTAGQLSRRLGER